MTLGLVTDVGHRSVDSRNTDAERAISFLPCERAQFRKHFVNPFRRVTFEKLYRLTYRKACRATILAYADDRPLRRWRAPSSSFLSQCRPDRATGARVN